jgi:hypothetical protein
MIVLLGAVSVTLVYLIAAIVASAIAVWSFVDRHLERKNEKRDTRTLVEAAILGVHGIKGIPDQPGLPERMSAVELHAKETQRAVENVSLGLDSALINQAAMQTTLEAAVKELHPNGGTSLRDDVVHTKRLAEEAAETAKDVAETLALHNDVLETALNEHEEKEAHARHQHNEVLAQHINADFLLQQKLTGDIAEIAKVLAAGKAGG